MREEWSMEIIHNFSEFNREAKAINMAAPKMSVSHSGGKTYMSHADDPEKKKKDPFGVNLAKPKMDVTHSGGKTTLRKFASEDQNIVAGMFGTIKKAFGIKAKGNRVHKTKSGRYVVINAQNKIVGNYLDKKKAEEHRDRLNKNK